jgi:hypothetical protein
MHVDEKLKPFEDALQSIEFEETRQPAPALCLAGFHRWSKWTGTKSLKNEFPGLVAAFTGGPDSVTFQIRRCIRCNQFERRVLW